MKNNFAIETMSAFALMRIESIPRQTGGTPLYAIINEWKAYTGIDDEIDQSAFVAALKAVVPTIFHAGGICYGVKIVNGVTDAEFWQTCRTYAHEERNETMASVELTREAIDAGLRYNPYKKEWYDSHDGKPLTLEELNQEYPELIGHLESLSKSPEITIEAFCAQHNLRHAGDCIVPCRFVFAAWLKDVDIKTYAHGPMPHRRFRAAITATTGCAVCKYDKFAHFVGLCGNFSG